MSNRKLKVLFHTDFSLANTGFGKNCKNTLTYLHKTGKYDIVNYCCGLRYSQPDLNKTPWKSIGSVPDNEYEVQNYLNQIPPEQRELAMRGIGYGALYLDRVILEEKPDVYFGVQDIWGVDYAIDRFWFPKIHSVIWTTLDSLPLLPSAVAVAPKISHYWIWSNFATKEMHRLGHKHVETMHGMVDDTNFKRLPDVKRQELRQKHNIPQNAFIIGFVFRNQLRKSVPNLLEGYALWKKTRQFPCKSFLLLHTHFSEGWNIHKLAGEYNVDVNEILTTYTCKHCREYFVRPFTGQDLDCTHCGNKQALITTNTMIGVNETQLNEVYNLMDVYCHPFTSGGQEIPVQEAKLAEVITLVTNYSCGEELCEDNSGSLPLDWAEYREHQTEFRKASTLPSSIAKQIDKVFKMDAATKRKLGATGRKWVIDNYAINAVGVKIEKFLDSLQPTNFDFQNKPILADPNANLDDIIVNPNVEEFVKSCYQRILHREPDADGFQHWLKFLSQ